MNNIEYFDEFLNESKFSDFKKRVYLNSTYIGFSGLAKLLLLLFPTSSHVLDINDYFSNGIKNYKETFDFFYKHNNNINKNTGIEFWGNSFACGPQGEIITSNIININNSDIFLCEINPEEAEQVRRVWTFFRDRRTDFYK